MKRQCIVFFLLTLPLSLFGQNSSQPTGELNHTQVVWPAWTSAGMMAGAYVFNGINGRVTEAFAFGAHLPAYIGDIPHGLLLTGSYAALWGGEYYMDSITNDYWESQFDLEFFHVGMISTYITYRDRRIEADPSVYRRDTFVGSWGDLLNDIAPNDDSMFYAEPYVWEPLNFGQMLTAPLNKKYMSDFWVWYLPVASTLNAVIRGIKTAPNTNAIWNTGTSYIGQSEVPIYASIPLMAALLFLESTLIGVAEDAQHRGFIYEEISSTYGSTTGKIVDAVYFPAVHIPGEIELGYSGGAIAAHFLQRSLLTLYIDTLYDRGGLGKTIAAHAWIDFPQLFVSYLLKGGAPQENLLSLLQVPGMGVGISLAF